MALREQVSHKHTSVCMVTGEFYRVLSTVLTVQQLQCYAYTDPSISLKPKGDETFPIIALQL